LRRAGARYFELKAMKIGADHVIGRKTSAVSGASGRTMNMSVLVNRSNDCAMMVSHHAGFRR
jgi:hypothetical protein